MGFIFKCANTSLSGLLVRNDFRNLLQSVALSASSDSSASHTSNCLPKLSTLRQLKILDNSFTKISLKPYFMSANHILCHHVSKPYFIQSFDDAAQLIHNESGQDADNILDYFEDTYIGRFLHNTLRRESLFP